MSTSGRPAGSGVLAARAASAAIFFAVFLLFQRGVGSDSWGSDVLTALIATAFFAVISAALAAAARRRRPRT